VQHLAAAAEVVGFNVHVSTPPGYEVEPERANLYGTDHFESFATRWMPAVAPIW